MSSILQVSQEEARDLLGLAALCRISNSHIAESLRRLQDDEAEREFSTLTSSLDDMAEEVANAGRAGYRHNTPKKLEDRLLAFHDAVGHMEAPQMQELLHKQEAAGVKNRFNVKAKDVTKWKTTWCPVCARCKTTNTSYAKKSDRPPSTHSNQLWFTDGHGPDKIVCLHQVKYHQVFVDDYDDFHCVYNMTSRTEEEMIDVMEDMEAWAEIDSRKFPGYDGKTIPIKAYFSDNEGAICGDENQARMKRKRIEHNTTVHDSSVVGNGKAERAIRRLKTIVKMLLLSRDLPLALAGYGWYTAAYLDNRRPKKRFDGFSSYEWRYNKPVDWRFVRPFGCEVIVNVKDHGKRQNKSQYDPSGEVRIHVGIAAKSRGWLCYNPRTKRVTSERNCIFQEDMEMQVIRPLSDYFDKLQDKAAEWSSGDEVHYTSSEEKPTADESKSAPKADKPPDEGDEVAQPDEAELSETESIAIESSEWEHQLLDAKSSKSKEATPAAEAGDTSADDMAALPVGDDIEDEAPSLDEMAEMPPAEAKRQKRQQNIRSWKDGVKNSTQKQREREKAAPPSNRVGARQRKSRRRKTARNKPRFSQKKADGATQQRAKDALTWADGEGPDQDKWKGRYYLTKDESYSSIAQKARIPTQHLIMANQEYHKSGGKVGQPIAISARHVKTVDPESLTYLWVPTDRGWINHPTRSPSVEEIEKDPMMDDEAAAEMQVPSADESEEPAPEAAEQKEADRRSAELSKQIEEAAFQTKCCNLVSGLRKRAKQLEQSQVISEGMFDYVGPRNREVVKAIGELVDGSHAIAAQLVKDLATKHVPRREQKKRFEKAYSLIDLAHEIQYCREVLELVGVKARDVPEPKRYSEAVEGRFSKFWTAAVQKELANLKNHKVYHWVMPKRGRKTVDAKWVFKAKSRNDGGIDKFKARLVARGFHQIYQVDYIETHAPVTVLTSFRACLAEAAKHSMGVAFFDISGAYLEADLEEEVFLEPPPGVEPPEPGMVMQLDKALYGLCQAGRAWNRCLHKKLISLGFKCAEGVDHCLYTKDDKNGVIRLNAHVDDCCVTFTDRKLLTRLLDDLKLEGWGLSQSDDDNRFLGMEVEHLPGGAICLHQKGYIQEALEQFNMNACKASESPHDSGKKHTKDDCPQTAADIKAMTKIPYRSAIGKLRYLADGTRPDIATPLGMLSQFLCNPGREHWEAVKKIFRYLKGTPTHGLIWGRETDGVPMVTCCTFSDASWADDPDDRTSRLGYITYSWGGPIGWKSRKERNQALSSTEAEYMAACLAATEVVWTRRLFAHLGYDMEELSMPSYGELTEAQYQGKYPSLIFDDNTGSIAMSKNPIKHSRNKHIQLKYHYVRQRVADGEVKLTYVPSEENIADCLTKCLAPKKFKYFRDKMVQDFDVKRYEAKMTENVKSTGEKIKWWFPYAPVWGTGDHRKLARRCGLTR